MGRRFDTDRSTRSSAVSIHDTPNPNQVQERLLNGLLQRINSYLVRWAKRKYKRLGTFKKVRKWWEGLTERQPRLFAHWQWVTDFKYSL